MARRRRKMHGLGAMEMDKGTLLIGGGVLIGLGTLAYYLASDGLEGKTVSTNEQWAKMTQAQKDAFRKKAAEIAPKLKTPYKAARDAYVANTATYTKSLYE